MTGFRRSGIACGALLFLLVLYVASPPLVFRVVPDEQLEPVFGALYRPLECAIELTGDDTFYVKYLEWTMGEPQPVPGQYMRSAPPSPQATPSPPPRRSAPSAAGSATSRDTGDGS